MAVYLYECFYEENIKIRDILKSLGCEVFQVTIKLLLVLGRYGTHVNGTMMSLGDPTMRWTRWKVMKMMWTMSSSGEPPFLIVTSSIMLIRSGLCKSYFCKKTYKHIPWISGGYFDWWRFVDLKFNVLWMCALWSGCAAPRKPSSSDIIKDEHSARFRNSWSVISIQ